MKAPYLLDQFGACFLYPNPCAKLQAVASIAENALGNLQALAIDDQNRKSALRCVIQLEMKA